MKQIFTWVVLSIISLGLTAQVVEDSMPATSVKQISPLGDLLNDSSQVFQNLEVYPNPIRDKVSIRFELTTSTPVSLQVFNLIGKQILVQPIEPFQGSIEQSLNLSSYPSGVYILRLETPQETLVRRLSKR